MYCLYSFAYKPLNNDAIRAYDAFSKEKNQGDSEYSVLFYIAQANCDIAATKNSIRIPLIKKEPRMCLDEVDIVRTMGSDSS